MYLLLSKKYRVGYSKSENVNCMEYMRRDGKDGGWRELERDMREEVRERDIERERERERECEYGVTEVEGV